MASLRGLDKDHEIVLKVVDDMIKEEIRFKSLPNITFMNICKVCFITFEAIYILTDFLSRFFYFVHDLSI